VAAGSPRRLIALRALAAGALAAVALLPRPIPVAAASLWAITASPLTIPANKDVEIKLTVTNLGLLGDASLGCVEVTIPGAFDLKEAKIVDQPAGKHWKGSMSGGSGSTQTAVYRAEHDGDELAGGETIVFKAKVKALSAGVFTWTARAWSTRSCDGGSFVAEPLAITVGPNLNPTPTPTPTPRPTPTPTPTPQPTATPTPTPTPRPTPTPTPRPTATPIISIGELPLPSLGTKPTPTPTPGPTPTPVVTRTPQASGEPAVDPTDTQGPAPSSDRRTPPDATPDPALVAPGPGDDGPAGRLRIGREAYGAVSGAPEIDVSLAAIEGLGTLTWAVPGLVLAVPGLLLVLAVLAQAVGGVLWLPVIRRRIGTFGLGGRRRP
jgi:hypothetical protein